ncbi:MAG: hypothetical protein ACOYD1_07575 [Candidatus Nanopelagicales bacterium]
MTEHDNDDRTADDVEVSAVGLLQVLLEDAVEMVMDHDRHPEGRLVAWTVLRNIVAWEAGSGAFHVPLAARNLAHNPLQL